MRGGEWVSGAGNGVRKGLAIGPVVVLVGYQEFKPCDAGLVGGPGGDNHAI